MKEYSEKELQNKAEAYCSAAEHCISEVMSKLRQWGAAPEVSEQIVVRLQKDRFLDESRFGRAFVRDKYRFAGWGRVKIMQAMRMKGLPSEVMSQAMESIDEDEYMDGLKELLKRKGKTVSARNEYERNTKLIRFAVGRGFAMDEILKFVKEDWADESFD